MALGRAVANVKTTIVFGALNKISPHEAVGEMCVAMSALTVRCKQIAVARSIENECPVLNIETHHALAGHIINVTDRHPFVVSNRT